MRRVQELFTSLLYGDQPAGWDIAGKKEVIRKISRDDFLAYRRLRYVASKTVVVVSGAFNPNVIERHIRERFSGLAKKGAPAKLKTKEHQPSPKMLIKLQDFDQNQ